jgi:O-antigen/teichoic acid export membrane protein
MNGSALAHFSSYSAARYLSEFLLLIRGFVLARILGPTLFGVWTQMKIVLVFLQFGQLGAHDAMLRGVPLAVGAGDEPRAERIKGSVLGFNLLSSMMIATTLVVSVAVCRWSWPDPMRLPWAILACIFPLSQLYWYVHLKLRSEKRFSRVSRLMVAFSCLSTLFGIVGALYCGLQGLLIGVAVSFLMVLVWAESGRLAFPRPAWDGAHLRELLKTGFPIMASGALLILLWNVDKLAIWGFMSRESLGIYALPSYLLISVTMIPEAVSAVVYPRLMESLGQAKSATTLEKYLTKPTLVISYLACPVLGVLFLALHLPILWFLPRYVLAIPPGQILIAALFFMVVTRIPHVLLVSLNRQRMLLGLTMIAVVVGVGAVSTLILSGMGLVGAALGAALSYVVYSVSAMLASLRAMRMSAGRAWSFLSAMLLPYIVTAATVVGALVLDLAVTGLQCLVVLTVGGVVFWWAKNRLGLLEPAAA